MYRGRMSLDLLALLHFLLNFLKLALSTNCLPEVLDWVQVVHGNGSTHVYRVLRVLRVDELEEVRTVGLREVSWRV